MKLNSLLFAALLPLPVLAAPIFTLQSQDFKDNTVLQQRFAGNNKNNPSCTGENVSPQLQWQHAPAETKSFALVITDPVGAKGLGVTHLVAYNIAADRSSFAQGDLAQGNGYTGGKNTPGTDKYYGPCPPAGSGLHHYNFVLIATDLPANSLPAGLTQPELFGKLKGHALAATTLVGSFANP